MENFSLAQLILNYKDNKRNNLIMFGVYLQHRDTCSQKNKFYRKIFGIYTH